MKLNETFTELIRSTASTLPDDVIKTLKIYSENSNNTSLQIMNHSIEISKNEGLPLCQDTGYPYFLVELPYSMADKLPIIKESIQSALIEATQAGYLRPNAVNPLNNKNSGNNTGTYLPYIEWEWKKEGPAYCSLLLKGGGSENVSGQYSLPFSEINAGRDMTGIEKTILHHIHLTQGKGCSPGILGIGIGGDRSLSMKLAKKQLFRALDDKNPVQELSELEKKIVDKANQMDIGPMGLGGSPTLLAAKAGFAARHPASFFVSIAYLCWVARRKTCLLPM